MARVVRGIDGRQGPLTLKEVKRAMGYGQVMLEEALLGNRTVTQQEVWRACGNALWATCCARVPRVVLWYQCAVFITRSRQISNPKFEFESDPNSYQNYHALDFYFFQLITSSPNISFSQHQYQHFFLPFAPTFYIFYLPVHFLP